MANEINVNVSCAISASGQTVNGIGTFQADLGGGGFLGNEQTIGTASELLVIGDVSTPAVVFIKNLDETNYIEVDNVTSFDNWPLKLFPGQAIIVTPQTGVIYCKANTAACKIWSVVG